MLNMRGHPPKLLMQRFSPEIKLLDHKLKIAFTINVTFIFSCNLETSTSLLLSGLSFDPSSSSCNESPPKRVKEERSAGNLAVSSRGTKRDNLASFFGPMIIILKTSNLMKILDQL